MAANIHIQKTDFSLPVIQLSQCDVAELKQELEQFALSDSDESIAVPCILAIDNEFTEPTFLAQSLECFRQHGFLPIGLKTELDGIIQQAKYAGLAVFSEKLNQLELFDAVLLQQQVKTPIAEQNVSPKPSEKKMPVILHRSITSGEQIYAEHNDLVVLGDVAVDAEVIADGNIYIGGSLMGKAYAGNSGLMNVDEISVRATSFEPQLISIAGFYQLYEDIPTKYLGLAVKVKFEAQRFEYRLE
ncbi:putative septum site-determining protein MinC [Thiomicrorhabdus immobilis]|uniref:Probable septum site-determining protein MinC n=1 Tax=Thiomicrorhabdus immobilis TaxID=2791037 RepID=A0ABN6CX68_9GAMM|nr:septum site-determining protein MinC [Thiomicrorhabdus immobilis]BCN93314.1 putative septum site-determining protein MinC [Thiomicrorhabdus immobilis]